MYNNLSSTTITDSSLSSLNNISHTNISDIEDLQSILHKGLVVKNYPLLCDLLGEPTKTGKSKQLQIANWKRYFEFKKQGQKFIITKVYSQPVPKTDKRKFKEIRYADCIELILMKLIEKSEVDVMRCQKSLIIPWFGFISPMFIRTNDNFKSDAVEELKFLQQEMRTEDNAQIVDTINPSDVWLFFQRAYKKASDMLRLGLNSMEKKRIIECTQEYNIVEEVHSPSGDVFKDIHEASPEEEERIKEIEKQAVADMGYQNMGMVYLRNKGKEFRQRVVNKIVSQEGWDNYFPVLNIAYCGDYKNNRYRVKDEELVNLPLEQLILLLNREIIDALKMQSERQLNNAVKKDNEIVAEIMEGDEEGWGYDAMAAIMARINGKVEQLGDYYVEKQNCLTDYLMPITPEQSVTLAEVIETGELPNRFHYKDAFKIKKRRKKGKGRRKS